MLPRIANAISEFIRPIATGAAGSKNFTRQTFERPSSKGEGRDNKRNKKQPSANRKLELVPSVPAPTAVAEAKPQKSGAAQAVIEMIARLQSQRLGFLRWLGIKTYGQAAKKKEMSLFKKGSMLDEKVD